MQQKITRNPWPRWAKAVSFTLLVLIVGFVFSNSLEIATESSQKSGSLLTLLLEWLPFLRGWFTEHILRKLGHFAEYTLVGMVLMLCLRSCTVRLWTNITKPILGGVLIALTDETIQLFVAGRSGQISDVWLDSSGVCTGLLVMGCILLILERYFAHRRRETRGTV